MKKRLLDYDAWLFDMDGVITNTATLHARSWKAMFDAYLKDRASHTGAEFVPFDAEHDYHTYVDGKPRYEGVDCFLRHRGIVLPFGTPEDPIEKETVCGLGNRKNIEVNRELETNGAEVYPTSLALVQALKAKGKKVAIVTSSKNCEIILKAAKIKDLFDAQMDGVIAAARGIPGKPRPDTYLEAARMLGVPADRAVVVEDAISGVQAGRAGEFGHVLGVDRVGNAAALLENGADSVVQDLGEIEA
ncbi:MAG: beta-phosphoglucomutase family hydrolase [Rhodospirillales bacterium]|nr:beta-phosphoglucomutase family hydrolase [Rhodospirillales bacterium]